MPNNLDLPDDLNRLIEKRERDGERRRDDARDAPAEERRAGADRRTDAQSSDDRE